MDTNTSKAIGPIDYNGVLDWAYDKAVNGVAGLGTAMELAESYAQGPGTLEDKANALIRWQCAKAGASGFLTGLGGFLTLPIAVPTNVASVLFIQIRLIAAVAYMAGWDLRDDRVKTLVYVCLVSKSAADVFKTMTIQVGQRLAMQAIKNIPGRVLIQINKQVGFRLLTKFGEKGIVNLGKAVPLVGGVIGGTIDVAFTKKVGNVARDTFVNSDVVA